MKDSLNTLFPIIGLIATGICFIIFISWNKLDKITKGAVKPVTPVKPVKRPPPKTEEGFQSSGTGATDPNFPSNTGAVIRFTPTENDWAYDQYELDNLYPSQALLDANNLIVNPEPETPDYGSSLSQFDATTLDSIPWDSDNTTSSKTDILWGVVSPEASKSIFVKTYHQNLMTDAKNFSEDPDPQVYSPILDIATRDETTGVLLQINDMAVAAAGQYAMTHYYERMMRSYTKANMAKVEKLAAQWKPGKEGTMSGKFKNLFIKQFTASGQADNLIKEAAEASENAAKLAARNAVIAEKLAQGKALTAGEKLIKFSGDMKKTLIKMTSPITKTLKSVKTLLRVIGVKIAKAAAKVAAKILGPVMTKLLSTALIKFGAAMGALYAGTQAAIAAMAAFPCVPCQVAGSVMFYIHLALMVIDISCMILTITLMVVLPTVLDKGLENGGSCMVDGRNGKAMDQIITDPVGYWIFANLTPIGSVIDAFNPYVCYEDGGGSYFRQGLVTPAWQIDPSISLYRHHPPPPLIMRADRTWWTEDVDQRVYTEPGWKKYGHTWRKDCEGGTWASSDVDLLCNAKSYVPKTYAKASAVPQIKPKESRVPPTNVKDTYITTYMREIRWRNVRWECGNCGSNETKPLAGCLCYTNCDSYNYTDSTNGIYKRFTTTISTDLHCAAQCNAPRPGQAGPTTTSFMCTDNSCKEGYDIVAGVCWKKCASDEHDIGALCRKICNRATEDETLGVCWKRCDASYGPKYHPFGFSPLFAAGGVIGLAIGGIMSATTCQESCGGNTPHEDLGICWGLCKPGDKEIGWLCREPCPAGMEDKAGVCWTRDTYTRGSIDGKSKRNYDAGYIPPTDAAGYVNAYNNYMRDKGGNTLQWCDFSKPEMLNRMAQFYYNQSIINATIDSETNLISYEYIIKFYGVIASSELSCDVACIIKTVTYNPITGGQYNEVIGAYYPEDPGNLVSYRRFYFISKATDAAGLFTVTACTHADYTASDAMIKSTTKDSDPISSLPKIFEYNKKDRTGFNAAAFIASTVTVGAGVVAGAAGGNSGIGQIVGGTAGGIGGQKLAEVIGEALGQGTPLGLESSRSVGLYDGIPFVHTNNDSVWVNYGPIYEYNASRGIGVVPTINFCEKIITTPLLCTDKYILRDTIDRYQIQNPGKRVKAVKIIEPRGVVGNCGCYYKWDEVSYDAQTNMESDVVIAKELLYKYTIRDQSTCAFEPTGEFITDLKNYPIRSYYDNNQKKTIYPTRSINNVPVFQARYIRILPSTSTNTLELSQIVVFDSTGTNLALDKATYVTSVAPGYTTSSTLLVDGTIISRSGTTETWRNANTNANTPDYFQIDLGATYYISSVMYVSRLDQINTNNNIGVRIQLFYTVEASAKPVVEKVTTDDDTIQEVYFTIPEIVPKDPKKPFLIPKALPRQRNLGAQCPVRCQDKPQIDAFMKTYNETYSSKILKVLKATTPSSNRCDYEVEMLSTDADSGKQTISTEHIRQKVELLGTPVANTGIVYGRYVRLRPPVSGGDGYLRVSQVIVTTPGKPNNPISIGQTVYATSYYKSSGIKNVVTLPNAYVDQNVPINAVGRYVRIYASKDTSSADRANFALSYVGVFNGGINISAGRGDSTSATSSYPDSALPNSIVNLAGGNIKPYAWRGNSKNMVWQNNPKANASRDADYFQIDLGSIQNITNIRIITRTDYGSNTTGLGDKMSIASGNDRTSGIRAAVLKTISDTLIYETTDAVNSSNTSITVDNATSRPFETRVLPNIWQNSSGTQTARDNDYWELDLGSIQAIDSIKYYPGSMNRTNGVRVQVLADNGIASVPAYDQAISGDAPYKLIQFNKCDFKYTVPTAADNMLGDFIQDNTPLLSAIDTKDGVFSFKNISNNIINVLSNIVKPISDANPLEVLNDNAKKADTSAKEVLGSVATNQKLTGCPNLKCSDPAVLTAIMTRYNELNANITEQYGIETYTMKNIIKAATSGPNTCDIVFNELYNMYDDYLYPATDSKTTIKAKRFTLNNIGNCSFVVDRGNNAIRDISLNELTIASRDSILTSAFTNTQCAIDCRNNTYLASIKQKLTQMNPNTTFTQIFQSAAINATTCEYAMRKNVTTQDPITKKSSTNTDMETYVKATFEQAQTGCSFTVKTVTETDPDNITSEPGADGDYIYYVNDIQVDSLPYLYNYDKTVTGSRVDETVKII